MPLIENDYDVFGVLFDVRTQGLDSVKGVVQGLISTEEWAEKAKGSLVHVSDALDFMKKSGVSAQDAMKFLSQGGSDDLIKFSARAQRAAQEVSKYVDEFKSLESRRRDTAARLAELEEMPSNTPGRGPSISQVNGELTRLRGQMGVITARLSKRREDDLSAEAIWSGNGTSSLQQTIRELGANKPTFNLRNPNQQATSDDINRERTNIQHLARELAREVAQSYSEVKQQLSAGQRKWFGEEGARPRSNSILDMNMRPQDGGGRNWNPNKVGDVNSQIADMYADDSRRRGGGVAKGAESTGEAVDQVMTESTAKRLTDQKIALQALHKRLMDVANGDPRQAEAVISEMTALSAHTREEASIALEQMRKHTAQASDDLKILAGARSTTDVALNAYRRVIKPERVMQRATQQLDRAVQQHIEEKTGQPAPDVSTIIYPGRVTRDLDEQAAKLRAEGLAIARHKALNPEDNDAMMAVKERYGKLIQRARARSEIEPFMHQGEELYQEDPAVTALRSRQEIELKRARLGSTEFEKQRLESVIAQAAKISQEQNRQASYKKLFGEKRIEDIHSEIDDNLEMTARQKNAKHNELDAQYSRWLRAGKKSNEAIDVERDIAVRQKAQRDENREARASMFDQRHEQRMALLRGEAPPSSGAGGSTGATPGATGGNPYKEAYQRAIEEARQALRAAQIKGSPIKGGSDAGQDDPSAYTRPGGFSASYERMLEAERQLQAFGRARARNLEDMETKIRKVADATVSYQDRMRAAAERANSAQQNYENVALESVGRKAAKQAEYDETRNIAELRYSQAQERTQLAIDALELKRSRIAASRPKSGSTRAGIDKFNDDKEEQLSQIDNQIKARMEIGGFKLDGTPREGLRSMQFQRSQNQAAFQLANFGASEDARVEAAGQTAQTLASRELAIRTNLTNRISNLTADLAQQQTRQAEDLMSKRERAEKRVADARLKYQQDAERQLEREFGRKSETLGDTLLRTRNPEQFAEAHGEEESILRTGAGGARAPISVIEQTEPSVVTPENQSRSYAKLRDQVTKMYADLDEKRRAYVRTEEGELEHLAVLRMKAEQASPELQGHAQDLLEANQIQAQERLIQAQAKVADAQQQTQAKSIKAHQQYYQNVAQEQKRAEQAMRDSSSQSLLNLTAQFAGAIAIVRGFVQEMVLYSARTETMKIVTEQMAKTNDINSEALNHQILAIKSLNITTQEAHATVQRMIFAQLDVAKATQLARVAQDAATISGENSSETLQKIITGITTGQTRILHYMGLQVSMNQVLRQAREELGREPTEVEKRTALLNAVLEQGAKIAGNYDAAMLTAGKQMLSLKRQFQEAQNAVGQEFQPALLSVISLMSRFSNVARENSTEFAQLTRVVAGLVAGLLILQGVKFATDSGGGFVSNFVGGLKLRGRVQGPLQAGEEALEAGGGKGLLSRIPVGNWITAGIAASAAVGTYLGSRSNPVSGVKDTISSIKSQNQIDVGQLDIQHRTGEIDDLTYSKAVQRFTDQDKSLSNRALAQISQVWIDRAKKAAQLQESFIGDYKGDQKESSFWDRVKTSASKVWTSLPILGAAETFTDNGMTRFEGAFGLHPGQSFFKGATSGANSKSIDKNAEYQLMLDRIRKKIIENGDVVTEAGIVSVKDQLAQFDEWAKKVKEGAKAKQDPLYNVSLRLEQNASNLDDVLFDKVRKSQDKVNELAERMITKSIVDPVEKLRHEMNFELKKYDLSDKIKPIYEDLKTLGLGQDTRNPVYEQYASDRKRRESLKVTQEQVDTYKNIIGAYGPGGTLEAKDASVNQRNISQALRQAGLDGLVPKLTEFSNLTARIAAAETKQRSPGGLVTGDPAFRTKYDTAQLVKDNNAEAQKIRDAFEKEIRQEEIIRANARATRTTEFVNQRTILQAPVGGGVALQRSLVETSSFAQLENENAAHQARVDFINKEVEASEKQNLLKAEQIDTNDRLLAIDRQRVLALEQINQQERQNALTYDISKVEGRLRLEEQIAAVQLDGVDQVMDLAKKRRDLELAASDQIFAKDNNFWEAQKRNDQIHLEYDIKSVENQKQRADQAKNEIKTVLEANSRHSSELRNAAAIGPYQEDVAIRENYEQKKAYIKSLYDLEHASKEELSKRDRELADADFEYLKQRMDLYKKQVEDGKKAAGQVFDAILASRNGGGVKLFTDMLKTTEKQIFTNLFASTFTTLGNRLQAPGQGTMEHPTFLGKMLEGTLFGLKDNPKKEIEALQARFEKERKEIDAAVKTINAQEHLAGATEKSITAIDALRLAIEKLLSAQKLIDNLQVQSVAPKTYGPTATLTNGKPVPGMVGVSSATADDASEGVNPQLVAAQMAPPKMYWRTPDFLKSAATTASGAYDTAKSYVDPFVVSTSALAKSYVTSPVAMSRVTRTPIYPLHDPSHQQAGFQAPFKDGIFVDMTAKDDERNLTIDHESIHALLSQNNAIGTLADDKVLQGYAHKIRKSLIDMSGPLYAGTTTRSAINEGMAYGGTTGDVPGLDVEASRAFLLRANSDLDPETRKKFLRLSKPFDTPIPYGRGTHLTNEDVLNNEGIGDAGWRQQAAEQAKISTLGKMYWRTPDDAKRDPFGGAKQDSGGRTYLLKDLEASKAAHAAQAPAADVPKQPAPPQAADYISDAAGRYGVDPATLRRIAQLESRGNPNLVNPKSGAAGLFQFMPATAAAYDLENPLDPKASSDAAARMVRDDAYTLNKALGRPAMPAELYLAHQQGPAGAAALLNNPDQNAVDTLSQFYKDRKNAERAVVNNGGTADMTSDQFAAMWSKKFNGKQSDDFHIMLPTSSAPPEHYVEPITIPPPYTPMAAPRPFQYTPTPGYTTNLPEHSAEAAQTSANAYRIAGEAQHALPLDARANSIVNSGIALTKSSGSLFGHQTATAPDQMSVQQADKNRDRVLKRFEQGKATSEELQLAESERNLAHAKIDPGSLPHLPKSLPNWLRAPVTRMDQSFGWIPRERQSQEQVAQHAADVAQAQAQFQAARTAVRGYPEGQTSAGMILGPGGTKSYPAGTSFEGGKATLPNGNVIDTQSGFVIQRGSATSLDDKLGKTGPDAVNPIIKQVAVSDVVRGQNATHGPGTTAMQHDPRLSNLFHSALNVATSAIALKGKRSSDSGNSGDDSGGDSGGSVGDGSTASSMDASYGGMTYGDAGDGVPMSTTPSSDASYAQQQNNANSLVTSAQNSQVSSGSASASAAGKPQGDAASYAGIAAEVGALGASGWNAGEEFSKGGTYHALGGIEALTPILSLIPGVGAFAPLLGAGAGLIRAIMGDPRENFRKLQEARLKQQKFYDPDVESRIIDTQGQLVSFDATGKPRQNGQIQSGPIAEDPGFSAGYIAQNTPGWVNTLASAAQGLSSPASSASTGVPASPLSFDPIAGYATTKTTTLMDRIPGALQGFTGPAEWLTSMFGGFSSTKTMYHPGQTFGPAPMFGDSRQAEHYAAGYAESQEVPSAISYNDSQVQSQGLGSAGGTHHNVTLNVNVDTMNAKSFMDNSSMIADAMKHQLALNHPVSGEVLQIARQS